MLEHPIAILVSFLLSVGIGITLEILYMKMIDAEYCRKNYVAMLNGVIEEKIKRLEDNAISLALKVGALAGLCLLILLFCLKILKLPFGHGLIKGLIFLLLELLGSVIVCVIIALIVAFILVDRYCVKHFGKTLAFIDMSNSASDVRKTVCSGTLVALDPNSSKYGDKYLIKIGKGLNSAIAKTIWFYRVIGMLLGFAAGSIVVSLLTGNILLIILAAVAGEAIFTFVTDFLAKNYCVEHFGYLATYYQLHIDIFSIKEQIKKANIDFGSNNSDSEIEYEERMKNLQKEIKDSISLKEGYQFASVPSRIFAEKIDVPGSYCCPYCYAEVSSDVSSMCVNCGKSLGIDATSLPSSEVPGTAKVIQASETVDAKKSLAKNKKLFIGIGIGAAVLVVGLVVGFVIYENSPHKVSSALANVDWGEVEKEVEKKENESTNVFDEEASSVSDVLANTDWSELEKALADFSNVLSSGTKRLSVGSILRSDDNLRLRARDTTGSDIITTMVKHTKVEILKIGREDESEGVESNWVLVEVLPGGKDRDGKRIPDGTTGWCFGGFLEPFSE